jgi:hypothetical protein
MQTRATILSSIRMKNCHPPLHPTFMPGLRGWYGINTGTLDMGKVVFLYRSLAYRNAAADMLRKARKLPRGAERSAARRYAGALLDLARTEAWLEGRVAHDPQLEQHMRTAASA